MALSLWPQTAPQERGVVIEQVESGSSAEKAGLRAGDSILAWSRPGARGTIDSPADLAALDIEESPRGPLTLEGLSPAAPHAWPIARQTTGRPQQTLHPWGIVCRPVLPPDVLAAYQHSAGLARSGAWADAAEGLRQAAAKIAKADLPRTGWWLLQRAAEWRAQGRQFKEAYDAFDEAIRLAGDGSANVRTVLPMACGDLARAQSDWPRAEQCYARALDESRKAAPASLMTAAALNSLGNVANFRGNPSKAEQYYRQALAIRRNLAPGSLDVGRSLNNLGMMRSVQGDPHQAEEYLTEALSIQEKLAPGTLDVSTISINLGSIALNAGDLDRAEEYYRRALQIVERLAPGTLNLASALNRLGGLLQDRGDLAGAEELARRAIAITSNAPRSPEFTSSLLGMARIAVRRGDLTQAEEYFGQALSIRETDAPDSLTVAGCLGELGGVAIMRGDFARGEELLLRALAIQRKQAPDSMAVADSLVDLGRAAKGRGDLQKAREYYSQALPTFEKLAPGSLTVANCLRSLGLAAYEAGEFSKAEEFYLRSLAILQKLAPAGLEYSVTLDDAAAVAFRTGDVARAEEHYRQALDIQEKLVPGTQHESQTLFGLAIVTMRLGQGDRALAFYERAANSLDRQMSRLGGPDEVRSEFRAQFDTWYRDYVDALLNQKQPQNAFAVLERSRARSMLTMLAERDLVFAADLPPEIQRERQRNAADYDRTQAELARVDPERDNARAGALTARLRELAAARESIAERVKRASPRFAALEYPQLLDLEGAREALDEGTVLLSYAIGRKTSTLFVVQSKSAAPGLSVYTLPVGEKALRDQVEEYRKLIADRSPEGRSALNRRARELYDLLVKPAEAPIAQASRVLLIPDGPLHVLPFAALRRNEKQYLVEWKPLHTIVSATLYAEVKKKRDEPRHPALQLVAFGDPLYPEHATGAASRTATPGMELARLPFSREEVTGIAALYPKRSQVYLGAEATEERAKSAAPQARYVHFATHAFVDERFPLNSALALTIPEKPAEGQENGLLQAWEIFEQLRLDADMVVLSACQTGLGKEVGGEGLIGLTRALQYAGARSIVASLWNVDDLKTSELMKQLYQQLEKGKSKDEALRAAQLSLINSRTASHPFFWAAFSLIGDWR